MKKVIYLVLLSSLCHHQLLLAQSGQRENVFENKLVLGLAANYAIGPDRFGVSGHAKWLFGCSDQSCGRFLITGKLTHTAPSNGGFFNLFDQGKYDNISAVHLMGGYRHHFYDTQPYISATSGGNGFFVEGNAGVSYIGHERVWGLGLNPVVGFSTESGLELTVGYQGVLVAQQDKSHLHLLEVGVSYRF